MYKTICMHSAVGNLYISEKDNQIVRITKQVQPVSEGSELLENCCRQLDEYFHHQRMEFDLPLFFEGTPFQCAVWSAMQKVNYGQKVSYQKLAEMAGFPKAVRAVGSACGKNPLAIVLPCHRIVRSDGKTGNYAYGEEMKQFLLDLEKEKSTW